MGKSATPIKPAGRRWWATAVTGVRLSLASLASASTRRNGVANAPARRRRERERDREAWRRLQVLFDNANDAILVYHLNDNSDPLRFIDANEAAVRLYGYRRDELLRMTPRDLLAPGLDYRRLAGPLLGDPAAVVTESVHVAKNGVRIPVEVSGHRFELDGRSTVLIISRDIRPRKDAEARVREAERRRLEVLESIRDGFVALDREGRFTYVNPQAIAVPGLTPEDLIGRNVFECFPALRGTVFEAKLNQAMSSTAPVRFEAQSPVSDRWLDVTVYPTPQGLTAIIRDETDRRRAEQAVRQSEQRLHEVLERIGDAFVAVDRRWRITYANGLAAQYSPRPPGELVGSDFWAAYPGVPRPELEDAAERALREQKPQRVRSVGPTTGRWFETALYPSPDGLTLFARDIHDQKMQEDALRESEARFRQMADHAPVMIWMADAEHRGTWFNRPWLQFTGRTLESELGTGWLDLVHPEDREGVWEACSGAFSRREPFAHDFRLRRHDGEYRWIADRGVPLFDADGGFCGYIGSCIDITERKATEKALRESEEFRRRIVESSRDCIKVLDLDGRLLSMNEQGQEAFGIADFGPYLRRPYVEFWEGADRAAAERAVAAAAAGGVGRFQGYCPTLRGEPRWWDVIVTPIRNADDQPVQLLAVSRDVTERRQAVEALERLNQTLEQRVAERTAIAEQRAEQLRRMAGELTQAEQRERRRLAHALHDHLQQLLVAAKLRIGMITGRSHDDALRAPLGQVDELLAQSIEMSRSLTVQLSPPILYDGGLAAALEWLGRWMGETHALRVGVAADPSADPESEELRVLLFEAVRELLFNVVKHAGVDRATVEMARFGDDSTRIVVTDAGVGFDLRAAGGRGSTSQGLGLLSVRERLSLLGGSFEIHSEVGKGTQMTLSAPRLASRGPNSTALHASSHDSAAGWPSPQPAASDGEGNSRAIRVLLADDHKILRQGLASLLDEEEDIEVVGEASDGAMAVEMAMRMRPDVVVMDITMPRMSGIEATRRITRRLPSVRVIGLSMHNEADMAAALRDAGAVTYLTKGGPSEALVEAIREVAS